MASDEITGEGIKAVIEAARQQREPMVLDVMGTKAGPDGAEYVPMLLTPSAGGGFGLSSVLHEVEKWRTAFATKPLRRKGKATLEELSSFIDHAKRFKDDGSAIFVDGGAASPTFTSIIDYHPKGEASAVEPRFGEHRGIYKPKFSPEWDAWKAADGKGLSQAAFAKLVTDQVRCVVDVAAPEDLGELAGWFAVKHGRKVGPVAFYADSGRMLDLAEGLTISVEERVTDVSKRDSGEVSIQFDAKAQTSVAGIAVTVPVAFVIELPIFVGGARYQLPVRLRLTTFLDGDTKRARWTIAIFGADESVLACVSDMRAKVATDTGLPVFVGSPE